MNNTNDTKDSLVRVKSFAIGPSGARSLLEPRTRYQFRLAADAAKELLKGIEEQLNTTDGQTNGVKLDIHSGKRETNDGTRIFDAAFLFVKALQDAPGQSTSNGAEKSFVPVNKVG